MPASQAEDTGDAISGFESARAIGDERDEILGNRRKLL
jgi:hypothetical protein